MTFFLLMTKVIPQILIVTAGGYFFLQMFCKYDLQVVIVKSEW